MSSDEIRAEVERLYADHMVAAFPPRLRGEEIEGVDMVMLDADVAGCVATWLGNHGQHDEERQAVLANASAPSTAFFLCYRTRVSVPTTSSCGDSLG